MKSLLSAVVIGLCAVSGMAAEGNAGFEKMKSLAGTWKGKTQDGTAGTVIYRVVSGGHAVQETLSVADMVTMYHADGNRVMLTHYCAANNQPRMRASYKSGDQSLSFAFVDATNLPDPKADHIHDLKLTFVDSDHIRAEWTNNSGGKPAGGVTFELERVK